MPIFNRRELNKINVFHKILKSSPKANFPIELENLLADYENSLDSLTISSVNAIASKYRVDLNKDFQKERTEFLSRLLDKSLYDNFIDDSEYQLLKHFSTVIGLNLSVLEETIKSKSSVIYKEKLESIFHDNFISDNEKNELKLLKTKLRLDDSTANSLYQETVKSTMDSYTKPIFESEIYSPEDEERLFSVAKNLGLNLSFPSSVQAKLSKYRQNWEILNGKLPILKTDIHLQAGEVLHHVQHVNWFEERTKTKRVNYSGFTYSTKIIGNIRWKAGTIAPHQIKQDIWKQIDSGQLFLTSKRIIFNGPHGNKVIPYSKILHFEAYSNGIQLQKESGKSPFLEFSNDVPIFAEILNQLLGRN